MLLVRVANWALSKAALSWSSKSPPSTESRTSSLDVLAAEAFQIISGVTHGLLLDPAARIFEWLWTKISTVVPNPVASFILSEVRNIVVTARHLAFAALITAICSSSMLVILGGFAKTAALDVAKQVGGGQACIQVAAKGLEYGYKYPAALILILLAAVHTGLRHAMIGLDKAIMSIGQD